MSDQLGLELKEIGMAQARQARDVQQWKAQFIAAATELAGRGWTFTSEDVVERVGLPRDDAGMNANNAVGAVMNGLAKRGVIRKTAERRKSHRASSHGRELAVWVRAFTEGSR